MSFDDTTINGWPRRDALDLPCALVKKPAQRSDVPFFVGMLVAIGVFVAGVALAYVVLFWLPPIIVGWMRT
jgi:hypothetical protein